MTSSLILSPNLTALIYYRYRPPVSIEETGTYSGIYDVFVHPGREKKGITYGEMEAFFDEVFEGWPFAQASVTNVKFLKGSYKKRAFALSGYQLDQINNAIQSLPQKMFSSSKEMLDFCMPSIEY